MFDISQNTFIENFAFATLTTSPVLFTVPHDGIPLKHFGASIPKRQNGVTLHDWAVWPIVSDALKSCRANVVRGMLPRTVVDYNRCPEEAYERLEAAESYVAYHSLIERALVAMEQTYHYDQLLLLDMHGFGEQPPYAPQGGYDLILGTGNRDTIAHGEVDRDLASFFRALGYRVFLPSVRPLDDGDWLDGAYTVRHWSRKQNVNCIQIEIAKRFRDKDSEVLGKKLADDLASFVRMYDATNSPRA